MKREEGIYEYTSPGGSLASTSTSVCGLYLISEPDERIEIEFEDYFVRESSCQLGGLVSVINGWELNGQFFPGVQDHLTPKSSRYQEFCEQRPLTSYSMDQNVGLIEFRIPVRGEGFRIRVSFLPNPKRKLFSIFVNSVQYFDRRFFEIPSGCFPRNLNA